MSDVLIKPPDNGFPAGWTSVTKHDEPVANTGIGFAIWRLVAGSDAEITAEDETALLLMSGHGRFELEDRDIEFSRDRLFDDGPYCLHVCAGTRIRVHCDADVEFCVFTCPNQQGFATEVVAPEDIPVELRGKDQADNACLRLVRTVLLPSSLRTDGKTTGRMELDLGEVVTLPGRWSSYPAHRHPQPEIYHYRFTARQGYGHAELGDEVYRISHADTVKILDGVYHSQVAAPGYGMYYFYLSRDAAGEAFENPQFDSEHAWIKDADAEFWMPAGFGRGALGVGTASGEHAWSGEQADYWRPAPKSKRS
mgnify:CR=1 FL=1